MQTEQWKRKWPSFTLKKSWIQATVITGHLGSQGEGRRGRQPTGELMLGLPSLPTRPEQDQQWDKEPPYASNWWCNQEVTALHMRNFLKKLKCNVKSLSNNSQEMWVKRPIVLYTRSEPSAHLYNPGCAKHVSWVSDFSILREIRNAGSLDLPRPIDQIRNLGVG